MLRVVLAGTPSLVVLLCALTAGSPAHAQFSFYSFTRADQPVAARYTPDPAFTYNAAGEAVEITRSATGAYRVSFGGMGDVGDGRGHVQVSAVGDAPVHCTVASWTDDDVDVRCFDTSGAATDTRFALLYLKPEAGTAGMAFAWSNEATPVRYTPPGGYSFNAGGGAITIARNAAGRYAVVFDGMGSVGVDAGHVQATGYGDGPERCTAENWEGTDVFVACFDAAGTAADALFTVLYLRAEAGTEGLAYAWADQPAEASYAPDARRVFNAGGGAVSVSRSGTGRYTLLFGGMDGVGANGGGHVQVTAFGGASRFCNVVRWGPADADVACFDAAGAPRDARFTLLLLKPDVEATGTDIEAPVAPGGPLRAWSYPNPFRGQATMAYHVTQAGPVMLAVYDVQGRRVRTLVDGFRAAGTYTEPFASAGLPAGVYGYRLQAGGRVLHGTVVLTQ